MTIERSAACPGTTGPRWLPGIGVLALLLGFGLADAAWPQVPDNRDLKLDPEDPVSPAYRDTLDERDRQRLRDAREEGHSFMPMFHGAGQAPGAPPPGVGPPNRDAAATAAPPREEAARAQRPVTPYERTVHGNPQAGGDGLAAMVGMLLEAWTRPPAIARLRYAQPEARAGDDEPSRTEQGEDAGRLLPVRAGDGFYARTLYAVDSDYPGPVVLELLQPPLAGAVAHGGFERAGQRLVLRLTSLTWDGATFPIDAWGVDPDCACYGIEGEVDRHFLARVVLPAAARFAEGFLNAVAMPARTLTVDDGTVFHERAEAGTEEALYAGAAAATRTLGDILMADAPKESTVRIPRNTPLVVMVARHFASPAGESR
ncbi:MAG: hypothetical protein OXN81_04105 [Alphaproteobacteria bacterium]|nr:hypothetical protein [Alphaproteobacteria bacterium]